MSRSLVPTLLAALLLAGCGNSGGEKTATARHKLHSVAATTLLLIQNENAHSVWPRYALEHLRDARKALDSVRKELKGDTSAEGAELVQQIEDTDTVLQDLERATSDQAALARSTHRLQETERASRDEAPR